MPFDYGQEKHATDRKGEASAQLRGAIGVPWAQGGPNGYNNGLGVSPRGDVLILTENYLDFAAELANAKKATPQETSPDNLLRRATQDQQGEVYRPGLYPGRLSNANLVCRWSGKGELLGQDALPGMGLNTFDIRSDPAGNIIVGVGSHQNGDGRPHIGGSLAKFAPKGGKLLSNSGGLVKLDEIPDRPPDFFGGGVGRAWAQNMYWSVPGLDQINFIDPVGNGYPCSCYHSKFDTDPYGRTFMPRAYAYHVQVVDSNSSRLCGFAETGRLKLHARVRLRAEQLEVRVDRGIPLEGVIVLARVLLLWHNLVILGPDDGIGLHDGNGFHDRPRLRCRRAVALVTDLELADSSLEGCAPECPGRRQSERRGHPACPCRIRPAPRTGCCPHPPPGRARPIPAAPGEACPNGHR